jgi:signal peptidase I
MEGEGGSALEWWSRRRALGRARAEARHLAREARRILRKKSYRIPQSVADEVGAAVDEVDASVTAEDAERTRRALTALDELMDEKLAFARKSTLREYAESIGVAVAIALFLRAFVVEAFQIPSSSMIPTLEVGDHIFVAKFSYGIGIPFTNKKILEFHEPERGDVIVFKYPHDTSTDYIKRVVGLPGDSIDVRHDEVFVNGKPMPRQHVGPYRYLDRGGSGGPEEKDYELWNETLGKVRHQALQQADKNPSTEGPWIVPAGHVFVMGDNRDNSHDSRRWGSVRHDLIKGRALIVWWSRGSTDDHPGSSWPIAWVKSIRWSRFFHGVD